jgi:hypothetical protein
VQASIGELIATYRARTGIATPIALGGAEGRVSPRLPYVPGNRVLIAAGVLAAPLVFAGYAGLTMLLVLPLLGLRTMFPRTAPSTGPWYNGTGRDRR